jgi:hypothetical protein
MTQIIKQLLGFARRRQPQQKQESLRAIAERTPWYPKSHSGNSRRIAER